MNLIFLTKSSVPIIGHIAVILGLIMDGLFRVTANFGVTNIGLSIILFTLIINLLMWPLTVKQQKSSRLMSVMQPELQAIQKKYRGKTDNVSVMRMQNETKAVYAKYGTSMTGGKFSLLGTVLGSIIIRTIVTLVYYFGIASEATMAFKAVIIAVVIVLQSEPVRNYFSKRAAARAKLANGGVK